MLGLIIAALPQRPMDSDDANVHPGMTLLAAGLGLAGMAYWLAATAIRH